MNISHHRLLIGLTAIQIIAGVILFKIFGGEFFPHTTTPILVIVQENPTDNIPILLSWVCYFVYLVTVYFRSEKWLFYILGFIILPFQLFTVVDDSQFVVQIWNLIILPIWIFTRFYPEKLKEFLVRIQSKIANKKHSLTNKIH